MFYAYYIRNLIFLSGTKRELSMYMDTINIFDVDWLEGMSTGIFTLNRVEAETIVGELEGIFGEGADNPLAGMFRFMPIERLNGFDKLICFLQIFPSF